MLRMVFVFILTVSLTFLPTSGPTAFAAPDEEVSVETPTPELAGAEDMDWTTEAEVLEFLKTINDMQLNKISRDITVATVEHVQGGSPGAQYTLGALLAVAGFGAIIVGLGRIEGQATSRMAPGWLIGGVLMLATGVFIVKTAAEGATVERVTYRELREIVGEDVAQQLENLQQWMVRVDRALEQKEFLDIQLTPYDGNVYQEQGLQPLRVVLNHYFNHTTGQASHRVADIDIRGISVTSDEHGRWWGRLTQDNISAEVFQRVKAYIKDRVLSELFRSDFTTDFMLYRVASPQNSPVVLMAEQLERLSVPIGPMTVRVDYEGNAIDAIEPDAPFYELSMEELLDEASPTITLWR